MKRFKFTLSTSLLAITIAHAAPTNIDKTCVGLASLKGFTEAKVKITKAEMVEKGNLTFQNWGVNNFGQHCLVQGKYNERTGTDGKPYAVGFEMRMPTDWNGRFFFQGGGGTDGFLRPALGISRGGTADVNALSKGFAVISTDAGHLDEQGPVGRYLFGLDNTSRNDHGFGHLEPVTKVGKALIVGGYGRKPDKSYFMGCSNGGRQAMKAAQLMPNEFDGFIAQAPAYRVPHAAIDSMRWVQTLAKFAPMGKDGKPDLGAAVTNEELKTISDAVLAKCDALDGVKDGMIYNTKACKFDIREVACKSGQNSACVPADKAAALQVLVEGGNKKSVTYYNSWPVDAGWSGPSFRFWRLGSPGVVPNNAAATSLIPGSVAYQFANPPTKTLDLFDYTLKANLEAEAKKQFAVSKDYPISGINSVEATQINYDAFLKRGGKMIFTHGMSDGIFSPNDTIAYLNRLNGRYGEKRVEGFAKLYLQPGMGHCSGGAAADDYDLLTPLVDWVEKGVAPQALPSKTRASSGFTTPMSRPMCAYPKYAHYKGAGDSNDGANFECRL